MSAQHKEAGAGRQSTKIIVDRAIAALHLWIVATEGNNDNLTDPDERSLLQVSARAIAESLLDAHEVEGDLQGLNFMFGQSLVRLLDSALWNCMGEKSLVIRRSTLALSAAMAIDYLKPVSAALAPVSGGVQ